MGKCGEVAPPQVMALRDLMREERLHKLRQEFARCSQQASLAEVDKPLQCYYDGICDGLALALDLPRSEFVTAEEADTDGDPVHNLIVRNLHLDAAAAQCISYKSANRDPGGA